MSGRAASGGCSTHSVCLHVHVHAWALAGAECCCSNSTLETESLKAAAAAVLGSALGSVLGSVFSKNLISDQIQKQLLSPDLQGHRFNVTRLIFTYKHIETTDTNLDEIWQLCSDLPRSTFRAWVEEDGGVLHLPSFLLPRRSFRITNASLGSGPSKHHELVLHVDPPDLKSPKVCVCFI